MTTDRAANTVYYRFFIHIAVFKGRVFPVVLQGQGTSAGVWADSPILSALHAEGSRQLYLHLTSPTGMPGSPTPRHNLSLLNRSLLFRSYIIFF